MLPNLACSLVSTGDVLAQMTFARSYQPPERLLPHHP
jgi:hypothetical protein